MRIIANTYSILFFSLILVGCNTTKKHKILNINAYRTQLIAQFREFKISFTPEDTLENYNSHTKVYLIDADVETSWNYYVSTPASQYWKGPLTKVTKAYSKMSNELYIEEDSLFPAIKIGTVYELNLQITKFYKIPVQFEVTKIDAEKRILETTYGADNRSNGKQVMEFIGNGNQTIIVHTAYFRSDNKIRDKRFYPYFHEKCTDEFHLNAKRNIEK